MPTTMPPPTLVQRRALLDWYDHHRRPLPWRRSRDSYRVWVAEVMLQQTRIAVVVPAYRRFLARFPDLATLAAADEDAVLAEWSGLGYYSRARNLHRACRQLAAAGATDFPTALRDARRLPGVGAYTAAAVLSIAYGQPYAVVDGNVVRVLSRLYRRPRPDGRGEPHQSLAQALLARRRAGDWNQAIMELGETVCLPASPRCEQCPLQRWCEARRHAEIALYPGAKPRSPRSGHTVAFEVVADRAGRVLLERGRFAYLKHMWLPVLASAGGPDVVGRFRHAILHRDFEVEVYARSVAARRLVAMARDGGDGERRIVTYEQRSEIGRAALLTKALRLVERSRKEPS